MPTPLWTSLKNLFDTHNAPVDNGEAATNWETALGSIPSGGEANTASNAGTTGQGLVLPKSGVDLPFKSITAGSYITVTDNVPNKSLVIAATVSQGPPGPQGAPGDLISPFAVSERVFRSPLTSGNHFTLADSYGYWVYIGQALMDMDPRFIDTYINIAGARISSADVGIFYSEGCPRKRDEDLTCIQAREIDVSTIGVRSQIDPFGCHIRKGQFIWIGIRVEAFTMPSTWSLIHDCQEGYVLSNDRCAKFEDYQHYEALIIRETGSAIAPDLRLTLD